MRKDYRHFDARSTIKIGPGEHHHTAGFTSMTAATEENSTE
jgi:hypothetical protein